jgi:adenylate kinase
MIILLIGAPGSGKGVQGQALIDHLGLLRISTGDMLREQIDKKTALGVQAKKYMDEGMLVPDDLIVKLLQVRISEPDCERGFILDGFPRTESQAQALTDQGLLPDHIIFLDVPQEVIIQRICGRLTHVSSGRVYHEVFNPPKIAGLDDVTGEPLERRGDDNEVSVRQRLAVFEEQTQPVIDYYKSYDQVSMHHIEGNRPPLNVSEAVLEAIEG